MSNIQNRDFMLGMFLLMALVMTGCSSHPPSAAQFMNVKINENKFGVGVIAGGSARVGDIYKGDSRIDVDYTDDESRGNLDLSLLFRFDNSVFGFAFENASLKAIWGGRSRYVGVQGWAGIGSAEKGHDKNAMPFSGGLMLIEEFPIYDNLRVGASEHISRNAYTVDENCGGLGIPSTYGYGEFGIGTYLTFEGFSIEFRYGREISEPRNRFYFMLNYAFMSGESSK
ncbi:MAG: hypothetical protein J6Y14_03220 [Fibrobacter sp.]|nr:hypothetical protein [Fibrobacter sp.]